MALKRETHLKVVSWILTGGLVAAVCFGCEELPTEPSPIDLSKDVPVAVDDIAVTPEETLVRINVLANDSSLVGEDLKISEIVTPPRFGTASIDGDVVQYKPELNYNGTDSLRYRVTGGVLSSTARVTITVTPVNDPPVAVDDSFTVDETIAVRKAESVTLDVLANDFDVDGDVLHVIRTSTPVTGNVQIASDGRSLLYDAAPNLSGSDQFTYTISDGNGGQDIATVVVTIRSVNDPPTVQNKSYATSEDQVRTEGPPGVLAGAVDPDGDPLTAVLVTDVEHGSLSLMQDGSFSYQPDANFFGSDQFEFAASDGLTQSAPATATITVTAVNDPPVATADEYSTQEDVVLEVPAPGVLANDYDVDNTNLNLTLVSGTSHGQLELHADGSFTYSPDAAYSGTDGFIYQIDDGRLSAQAAVSITVTAVNDAPVAASDQYDVAANTDLVVPAPGVLENDSDQEGDVLSVQLAQSSNGTLDLNGDGGFVYSPPPGFFGTDSFTYRASDGVNFSDVASVVILVTAVGTPPVAQDDEYTMPPNDTLKVAAPGVLANDTDQDGDALTTILVDSAPEGTLDLNPDGGFVYTPPEDFVGTVNFTYRAHDAANVSGIAKVTIIVSP